MPKQPRRKTTDIEALRKAVKRPPRGLKLKRPKVTLVRRFLGIADKPVRYVIVTIPPQ